MSSPTAVPPIGPALAAPTPVTAPVAAPVAAPLAPDPTPTDACRNCGTERHGEYCHGCGQHFLEDRLTLRLLASEAWERMTFERGFLRTLVDMTVRPGVVIRRYVEGQRRRYVSPVTYLLFGAAVSLLGFQLVRPQMEAWVRESVRFTAGTPTTPGLTAQQNEALAELTMRFSQQTTFTSLGMGILFALMLRLLFRRQGINLAESLVFALFTFAHVFLVAAPLSLLIVGVFRNIDLYLYLSFPLYLLVGGLAAAQYFGRPVRSVLKTGVALAAGYGIFSLVMGTALIVHILLTVR